MFERETQILRGLYDLSALEEKSAHERVRWGDPQKQYLRFAEIVRLIDDATSSDLTILDIGCGNGEFFKYLNFIGFRGTYRGVDISTALLGEAKERFPNVQFMNMDLMAQDAPASDVVVISGVFNYGACINIDYVTALLRRAASFARKHVIFNAISTYVNFQDTDFFYLSPEQAITMAASISHRFVLRHGHLPYNFTICISVDNVSWESCDLQEN